MEPMNDGHRSPEPIAELDQAERQTHQHDHHRDGCDLHGETSSRFSAASKPESR
jgi:hypothetical protein